VPGLLALLAAGLWSGGVAWHWLAAAAAALPVPCAVVAAVMRPWDNNTKRGLSYELIFAMGLEGRLVEHVRERHGRHFRKLEEAGALDLGHRYRLRLEPHELALTTEYPAADGVAATQEYRRAWDTVAGVERTDRLILLLADDGTVLFVPRSAFADAAEEGAFVAEVEALLRSARGEQQRVVSPSRGAVIVLDRARLSAGGPRP
jgi:hypothetical protein